MQGFDLLPHWGVGFQERGCSLTVAEAPIMAKEPLNKPVQETGSNHQMVKDFPKDVSEVSTAKKPVEENDGLPKRRAASSGVEDGPPPPPPIIKVSVETQTETEFSEQISEVNPEPEVEKESAIKATSTQTPLEGKEQLPPGGDAKGKKKKQRPKKKRPSKEKKEAQPTPSSDSWSISFQFPMITGGDILKLVYTLVLLLFFCSIGFTQSSPVDNVEGEYHAYSFVTESSFANATLDVKKNVKFLCTSITISQKKVLCNGSWIFLINKTMLLLVTKEESHYFVETGKDSLNMKYEGAFRDPESARNRFDPKEAQAAPFVPTKTQQVQQTTNEMPWWQILLIVVAILVIAGVIVTVVLRNRLCRGNRQNEPSANQTELERLENSQVRNGPELPATA